MGEFCLLDNYFLSCCEFRARPGLGMLGLEWGVVDRAKALL